MYLFLILAIPCFLVWYCISQKQYKFTEFIPVIALGIFTGIITVLIEEFFIYFNHVYTLAFMPNFSYFLLKDSIVPCVISYGIFLLCSIKSDDFEYKTAALLPVVLAFYLVFLPYSVITSSLKQAAYLIFIKPVVYISMVTLISEFTVWGYKIIKNKNNLTGIAFILADLIFMVIPPLIETMWYLKVSILIVILLAALFTAGAVVEYLFIWKKGDECPYPPFGVKKQ